MVQGARYLARLIGFSILFLTGEALAERVLLVRPPGADPVLSEAFNRLRAELGLQRFEVVVVERDASNTAPRALGQMVREAEAFAGIGFVRRVGTTATDVCMVDRVTGKISIHELSLPETNDTPSVLAVRTVDLLRSGRREAHLATSPAPDASHVGSRRARPELQRVSEVEPLPWQLRAAGAALSAGAELGLAYGARLSVRRRIQRDLSLGVGFAGPFFGASLNAGSGVAAVRQELGLIEGAWTPFRRGPFEAGLVAGAGIYHLLARGEDVEPPLYARSDEVSSFAAALGLEFDLRVSPHMLIGVGTSALLLAPRPGVAVGPERRRFGFPLASANVGLGVEF